MIRLNQVSYQTADEKYSTLIPNNFSWPWGWRIPAISQSIHSDGFWTREFSGYHTLTLESYLDITHWPREFSGYHTLTLESSLDITH